MPGVDHVAIINSSGSLVGGNFPKDIHSDTLAAMSAIIHAAAESLSKELRTSVSTTTVALGDGHLVLLNAGETGVALCKVSAAPDAALMSRLSDAVSG